MKLVNELQVRLRILTRAVAGLSILAVVLPLIVLAWVESRSQRTLDRLVVRQVELLHGGKIVMRDGFSGGLVLGSLDDTPSKLGLQITHGERGSELVRLVGSHHPQLLVRGPDGHGVRLGCPAETTDSAKPTIELLKGNEMPARWFLNASGEPILAFWDHRRNRQVLAHVDAEHGDTLRFTTDH